MGVLMLFTNVCPICCLGVPCSSVMAWLHCRLSFSLLRSAIACLRGAFSHSGCPASRRALDLSLIESQVPFP